ncbi:MAG: hypothetical protein LBU56_02410 [Rickettsiales bacterium]|jgi:hypothetical protein|nr:hypothetical protein [Rickettsiales bacterium]
MTDINTLRQELNASKAKRHSIRTKLTIFVLALILPISAVMAVVLGMKYSPVSTVPPITQDISKQVSTDFFGNISQLMQDEIAMAKTKRSASENELNRAVELQSYVESFSESITTEQGNIADIFAQLTEEEVELFTAIWQDEVAQSSIENEKDAASRWFFGGEFKFKLYAHLSLGWFVEGLSSSLITLGLVALVVKITGMSAAQAGVVGLVIGALVSATIGALLIDSINRLMGRNGQAGFTHVFIEHKQWWAWNWNVDINIFDIVWELINFGGGRFIGGSYSSRPAGTNPFRWAW